MISILYLTCNRLASTRITLPTLLDSDPDMDYKVYIHDNGSKDGTQDYLKSLSHPKIAAIKYSETNLGISPVTNNFWATINTPYVGKIDNDILVPKGWVKEVMLRLSNPQKDKIGPITLYHWIEEWLVDFNPKKASIIETANGSRFVRSTHTGGNYIMHRYLVDMLGPIPTHEGLKGGFTTWQYAKTKTDIRCGYVYPFKCFDQPAVNQLWEQYKAKTLIKHKCDIMDQERHWAKILLEMKDSFK